MYGILWQCSKEFMCLQVRLNQFQRQCWTVYNSISKTLWSTVISPSVLEIPALFLFRVTFSLRERKLPQSARCLQFGKSSTSWEQRVDPGRFLYCSVAKRSYPQAVKSTSLSSYQPEVVKKPEFMSSWLNGKRVPLILTGSWLYSTEELCHAKHPQCCITDQLFSFQRPTA